MAICCHEKENKPLEEMLCRKWFVEFEVLSTVTLKVTFSWGVTPCSLIDVYRRLEGTCYLHLKGISEDSRFHRKYC
jgi:hypothetical protein